jgi:death on curing protein
VDPIFLSLTEVLEIHNDQIARYGGSAGIRDLGLLKSAVAMPAAEFGGQFLHADLAEMAAAYVFHLVQNHAFIDGNKRTGAVAVLVFLGLNNLEIEMDEDAFEQMIWSMAKGSFNKVDIASFFREALNQA